MQSRLLLPSTWQTPHSRALISSPRHILQAPNYRDQADAHLHDCCHHNWPNAEHIGAQDNHQPLVIWWHIGHSRHQRGHCHHAERRRPCGGQAQRHAPRQRVPCNSIWQVVAHVVHHEAVEAGKKDGPLQGRRAAATQQAHRARMFAVQSDHLQLPTCVLCALLLLSNVHCCYYPCNTPCLWLNFSVFALYLQLASGSVAGMQQQRFNMLLEISLQLLHCRALTHMNAAFDTFT